MADTDRLPKSLKEQEADLPRLYAAAQNILFKELTKTGVSAYKEAEIYKSRKRIDGMIQKLNSRAASWAREAIDKAYRSQRAETRAQAEILGFRPKKKHIKATLLAAVRRAYGYLEKANASMKRTADNYYGALRYASSQLAKIQEFDDEEHAAFLEETASIAALAVKEGWTRVRLSNLLEHALRLQIEDGDFVIINGRNYNIESYAEMVARTEIRKAQTEAAKETCSEYGCDLVEWSIHANPCPECAELEGQVFSLSGQDVEFPQLGADDEPPLHPNCGHSLLATSREAMEARQ
jgi:hypothetical protein